MKKLIVMAVPVVLILSSGVIGVMKWMEIGFFKPPPPAEGEETPASKPKSGAPARFVDVDPLNVTVIEGNRLRTVLQISLKLEVATEKDSIFVQRRMVRFSDAALRDLYDFLPRLLREVDRIEIALLKDRLQLIADKIFGKGMVKGVLIQSVHDTSGKT